MSNSNFESGTNRLWLVNTADLIIVASEYPTEIEQKQEVLGRLAELEDKGVLEKLEQI